MHKPRVLIVEDEAIIAWELKQTLEHVGAEVLAIAASASKAVDLARTGAPDLILMDIRLKGARTGIDAAKEIRQFSQTPIVFLTGNPGDMSDPAILAAQAQGIYSKPPWEHDLREILRHAGAHPGQPQDGPPA